MRLTTHSPKYIPTRKPTNSATTALNKLERSSSRCSPNVIVLSLNRSSSLRSSKEVGDTAALRRKRHRHGRQTTQPSSANVGRRANRRVRWVLRCEQSKIDECQRRYTHKR